MIDSISRPKPHDQRRWGGSLAAVRLFVALYPPAEALDHLADAVTRLRLGAAAAQGTNVRLAARPLWHVTLAFLGEVPEERVQAAQQAVSTAVGQWYASTAGPWRAAATGQPRLRLAGGGTFGRRRFTLLWVGLAGDLDALRSLTGAVRRRLRSNRIPHDRKPLRPHLTVARPGERLPPEDLAADLEALERYNGPAWAVGAVHLVRSHQGPRPVHEPLAAFPLAPTPPV
jgi:RNA 2',3'-cyclic 3'-phosphodiesterase